MSAELDFDLCGKKIFVCGHNGMVGKALVRRLQKEHCILLTVDRKDLDLCDHLAVRNWFQQHKPEAVILAAAKVGGIFANDTMPVPFLFDNLRIQNNVINAAFELKVKKFLFLGGVQTSVHCKIEKICYFKWKTLFI